MKSYKEFINESVVNEYDLGTPDRIDIVGDIGLALTELGTALKSAVDLGIIKQGLNEIDINVLNGIITVTFPSEDDKDGITNHFKKTCKKYFKGSAGANKEEFLFRFRGQ